MLKTVLLMKGLQRLWQEKVWLNTDPLLEIFVFYVN